jgi:1,4-dihydroxy-2-naphthoate octaprenyltransferase
MIWNNREGWIQMSLMALSEGECIDVPSGTSVIRDIRIAPSGTRAPGRLALVASLGKKLTVFRYVALFLALFLNLILCLLFNHPGDLWMSLCILWILSCSCFLMLSVVETG